MEKDTREFGSSQTRRLHVVLDHPWQDAELHARIFPAARSSTRNPGNGRALGALCFAVLAFLAACGDNGVPPPDALQASPDAPDLPACPVLGCTVPTCVGDVCTCNGEACVPTGIPAPPACAAVGCADAPSGSADVWTPCDGTSCFCRVGATAVVACSVR